MEGEEEETRRSTAPYIIKKKWTLCLYEHMQISK